MQISKATAKDMIQNSKGKIFTTTYIKKDKSNRDYFYCIEIGSYFFK